MNIAISVESTSDLSKNILTDYDIKIIPFHINLGDMSFKDGEHTTEEMFEFVDKYKTLPKTTAINEFEYTEFFSNLLKDYDAVVHVSLSSEISSSCRNAIRAAKGLENVYVIDSMSLSTGIGLLAMHARELANEGIDAKIVAERVQARAYKLQVSFVIERLDYLYKGGRCNSLQLLGANLLKIRPRIILKDGKMISDKKYKGKMDSVIAKYCQGVIEEFNTPDKKRIFITYTSATEEMLEAARAAVKSVGFEEIIETRAGGTIASHCGAHTLGILYFNDGE